MFRETFWSSVKCAACAATIALGGCSSMQATSPVAGTEANSQTQLQMASVNQGRFPAPAYSQIEEAPYALTGEPARTQSYDWATGDRRVNVGNSVVIIAPTP